MGGTIAIQLNHPKNSETTHSIKNLFGEFEILQCHLDDFYLLKKYNIAKISQIQKMIDNLRLKIDDFILETEKSQKDTVKKSEFILQSFIIKEKLIKEEKYLHKVISYYNHYNVYLPNTNTPSIQEFTQQRVN